MRNRHGGARISWTVVVGGVAAPLGDVDDAEKGRQHAVVGSRPVSGSDSRSCRLTIPLLRPRSGDPVVHFVPDPPGDGDRRRPSLAERGTEKRARCRTAAGGASTEESADPGTDGREDGSVFCAAQSPSELGLHIVVRGSTGIRPRIGVDRNVAGRSDTHYRWTGGRWRSPMRTAPAVTSIVDCTTRSGRAEAAGDHSSLYSSHMPVRGKSR